MNNRRLVYICCSLVLLSSSLSPIKATAYALEAFLMKSGVLAFFISEHHRMEARAKGRTRPSIEKMIEILRRKPQTAPHIRYRVLIEVVPPSDLGPDFLTGFIDKIQGIPGVIVENIEVRKLSAVAGNVFANPSNYYYWYKQGKDEDSAAAMRQRIEEIFGCNPETITFSSILEEFRLLKERALELNKQMPEREPDWREKMPLYSISFDFIGAHEVAVNDLKKLLHEYGIESSENIINFTHRVITKELADEDLADQDLIDSSMIFKGREQIKLINNAIFKAGYQIFDFYLLHKLLMLQQKATPDERILIFAGGGHVEATSYEAQQYGFEPCCKYTCFAEGVQEALQPEQFENIEQSMDFFREEAAKRRKEAEIQRALDLSLVKAE